MSDLMRSKDVTAGSRQGSRFTILRVLLGTGMIAGMIWLVGPDKIWQSFTGMALELLLVACALFAFSQVLMAVRWRVVLGSLCGRPPGVWYLVGLCHIGMFFNFFLPSTVGGDVVRAEMAKKYCRGRGESYSAVLFDRFAAFVAVVLIGTIALCLSFATMSWFNWQFALLGVFFIGITVSAFVVLETSLANRVLRLVQRGPLVKPAASLLTVLDLLQGCAAKRLMVIRILALALMNQALMVSVTYSLGLALGLEVPILFHFVAVPIILLVTLVPISVNGLGIREVSFVVLYSQVGVPSEAALALSFAFTLVLVFSALIGGLFLQFPSLYRCFEDRAGPAKVFSEPTSNPLS